MALKKFFAPECHPDRPYHAKGLCERCYQKKCYHERYRSRVQATSREAHIRRKLALFGMTRDDYDAMLTEQLGRCAICLEKPMNRRLDLDHDEKTMKARGLLCNACNQAIGLLKHDVSLLIKAQWYLSK